ncbi:hypothetical protein KIW84_072142 [Lathyrus oleraceus]|uniref:DUF8018 domain-containing protein n=1 Tax=Pisum sativum TaxID=3888 RepID=A0A9D4VLC0_PEA|nr:hypothetical protein KIW84_072142 [Pisum sativum]
MSGDPTVPSRRALAQRKFFRCSVRGALDGIGFESHSPNVSKYHDWVDQTRPGSFFFFSGMPLRDNGAKEPSGLCADGGVSIGNGMMPHGAAESTNSDLFTYTSDLVEDSGSSGRSRSTSTVNQPLPGEQAMPPALPVMQEAANQAAPVPYPYPHDEILGGDSVESIQRRLLGGSPSPSAHLIQMARIQAEDLFEVKVDICQVMAGLHPGGDWMGRGARALDNPRTFTGEDSLENLSRLRDGVVSGDATTITTLKQRMLWRRSGGDTESHA